MKDQEIVFKEYSTDVRVTTEQLSMSAEEAHVATEEWLERSMSGEIKTAKELR